MSLTNFPNGMGSFFVDSNSVAKESAYTVVITTDSGKTFTSETDGTIFTLPSIAIGNTVTFVNMAPDGMNTLTVSPAAADGITYAGSSTDNKDIINTKATQIKYDYVKLVGLSADGWLIDDIRGTWVDQS